MRLRVEVGMGYEALTPGETGSGELARILMVAACNVEAGEVAVVGDGFPLFDANGAEVGAVSLLPSGFKVGDPVWDNPTGRQCLVASAQDASNGMQYVVLRDALTSEPRGSYYVYADGTDDSGRCWVSRRR